MKDEKMQIKTPEQIALEIQMYFGISGTPQQFDQDTKFIAAKIRDAIEVEREQCALRFLG